MLLVNVSNIHSQIPPAPPRPDFDEPRHKLAKLREGQSLLEICVLSLPHPLLFLYFVYTGEESMTKEEYSKMKQELEAYVHFSYNYILVHLFSLPLSPSLFPLSIYPVSIWLPLRRQWRCTKCFFSVSPPTLS